MFWIGEFECCTNRAANVEWIKQWVVKIEDEHKFGQKKGTVAIEGKNKKLKDISGVTFRKIR